MALHRISCFCCTRRPFTTGWLGPGHEVPGGPQLRLQLGHLPLQVCHCEGKGGALLPPVLGLSLRLGGGARTGGWSSGRVHTHVSI